VEFPIATTVAEAEALFALARQKGHVLHVEHIELLDAPFRTLAAHVRAEMVRSVSLTFTRPGPSGADALTLAAGNEARLHRLTGVAGPIASVDRVERHPGSLDADLTLASGAPARCSFRQGPSLPRHLRFEIHTVTEVWEQSGDVLRRNGANQTLLGPASLFASDQRVATARILDGAPSYVSEERILHVLDVVESLSAGRSGAIPGR
jgi:biliverdin reductase